MSIIGQYQAVGPLADKAGAPAIDPSARLDHPERVASADGKPLAWRRLDANAESIADLSILAGDDPAKAAYVHAPITSPADQSARLVIDSRADVTAWLNGKPVELAKGDETTRTATIALPKGESSLLIRVPGGAAVSLVTSLVADKPLSFTAVETKGAGR